MLGEAFLLRIRARLVPWRPSTGFDGIPSLLTLHVKIYSLKYTTLPLFTDFEKNRAMEDVGTPDPHQNPHHPFEEPERYRAFEEGWVARGNGQPRTSIPYPLSQPEKALAWLDGWTTIDQRTHDDPVPDERAALAREA